MVSQSLVHQKAIVVGGILVSASAAKESPTDIPWAATLSYNICACVHRLILAFNQVIHKETHMIGLCF